MTRTELTQAVAGLGWRTEGNDIIRYEDSSYCPRLPTFAALARVLCVSMDVLWYGKDEAERLA